MSSSAIGSVLESVLGSVLQSILRAYLGAYSQPGWECAIDTPPHLSRHPKGIREKIWLEDVTGYPAVRNHTNCVDI